MPHREGHDRDLVVAGRHFRRLRRRCGVATPRGIAPTGIDAAPLGREPLPDLDLPHGNVC